MNTIEESSAWPRQYFQDGVDFEQPVLSSEQQMHKPYICQNLHYGKQLVVRSQTGVHAKLASP